jgi:hypothetical protein
MGTTKVHRFIPPKQMTSSSLTSYYRQPAGHCCSQAVCSYHGPPRVTRAEPFPIGSYWSTSRRHWRLLGGVPGRGNNMEPESDHLYIHRPSLHVTLGLLDFCFSDLLRALRPQMAGPCAAIATPRSVLGSPGMIT